MNQEDINNNSDNNSIDNNNRDNSVDNNKTNIIDDNNSNNNSVNSLLSEESLLLDNKSNTESRPITSQTDDILSNNHGIDEGSSQGSLAAFEKIYHPHSPSDKNDIKDLDEITKLFNNSLGNIPKDDDSDDKSNEEENVEDIVRNLSGFLHEKKVNNINVESVKTLNDIMREVEEEKKQDTQYVIEKVKNEYNRLSTLLVKSKTNETALYNKCIELSRFLNSCIVKIQSVLNVSRNDRINIVNLNLELEKAWKRIDEKNESELLLKETIELLKTEIVKYRKRVKGKLDNLPDNLIDESSVQVDDDDSVNYVKGLEEKNVSLTKEINKLHQDILKLEGDSIKKGTDLTVLNDRNKELSEELTELQGEYIKVKLEKERETREKRKLESNIEKLNQTIVEKEKETEEKLKEISSYNDTIERYKDELSREQMKNKNADKTKEFIEATVEKQQSELDEQNVKINLLVTENYKSESIIRKLEMQISQLQNRNDKLLKSNDQLVKKQKMLEECITSQEEREEELNKKIELMTKEEEEKEKECENIKRKVKELTREREILNRNYIASLNNNSKQNGIIKVNEQTIKNTEHEIQSYRDEASKMRKIIYSLEKERDNHVIIQSSLKNSLNDKQASIKMLHIKIEDSEKKYSMLEKKYDDCMKLYEDIKTDRNNYSKKLAESLEEVLELKRRNQSNSHIIDTMKEEVRMKDTVIAKAHFEKKKLEKEKESLLNQLSSQHNELLNNRTFIKNLHSSEENMRHTLIELENERKKLLNNYNNLVKEKNLMQNQIILRNDEITLLYEKLKLQNSALSKGEFFYNERIEDIRVLKLEVKKLRREKSLLSIEANSSDKLRKVIYNLQRQAVINNTKMKVLEDELETPLNIHRWRKLSGSDPESFDLILKIQSLQKRLLRKTEEVIGKEQELQEKNKLYEKLKKLLERQPGVKTMEQLRFYRESLKSKINESKSLASELNMYQAQIEDYKVEVIRLNEEIQNQKSKYYDQKKKFENLSRKFEMNSNKIRSYPLKRKKKLLVNINNSINDSKITTV
ncbi:hypothetical protein BCR32DRAFT_290123 [Anaeromyces robustus]|uniref:Cilia- and flagella-associated protein 58 central coiled coil domain-containing protein n=1 Tax=Anaeromyces robustus TaxID=1754192 RepID=A0A1Y1XLB3_9FUNG|nr:hypothetical protein BCR32DRAFT_290123 [Anaeromyces robustus]|eukprot:ORX86266.1 hypothetical protein BCR32DRAFT_290123 [Anaeromyces robustus]